MTPADPLAVARSALRGWVTGAQVIARRGSELADRLLDLVVTRPSARTGAVASLAVGGPPAAVDEAKFHLGPETHVRPPERDPVALPRGYGRDRIVLLPRDPWTLFTYWEITPQTRLETVHALGSAADRAREVLRVYDATFVTSAGDRACLAFDVEAAPDAARAYLHVSRPGASYVVEVGLRTAANRFLPMARSNTVSLPAAAPSSDPTVRWAGTHPGAPSRTIAGGTDARGVDGGPRAGVPPPR